MSEASQSICCMSNGHHCSNLYNVVHTAGSQESISQFESVRMKLKMNKKYAGKNINTLQNILS